MNTEVATWQEMHCKVGLFTKLQ